MKKGAATKQKIIEQTSGLFNTKGYYATTLSEIMRETGLQKGGIYNHFSSKEELSLEVFRHNIRLLSQKLSESLANSKNCEEQLITLITLGLEISRGSPVAGGCPVLNAGVEADGNYTPLQQATSEALGGLKSLISSILKKGIEEEEFQKNINVRDLTDFFISSFEGAVFLAKVEQDDKAVHSVIRTLKRVIQNMIIQ